MSKSQLMNDKRYQPDYYEIRIQGHLHKRREGLFEGLSVTRCDDGSTVLMGPLPDQTALHSILLRIRNMNLKLISINQINIESERDLEELRARNGTNLKDSLDIC
jgi:chorismate synthase